MGEQRANSTHRLVSGQIIPSVLCRYEPQHGETCTLGSYRGVSAEFETGAGCYGEIRGSTEFSTTIETRGGARLAPLADCEPWPQAPASLT